MIYQRIAVAAAAAAALTADVTRIGWLVAAEKCITIAAIAVILLDAAIAGTALYAPCRRLAARWPSAVLAGLAASSAVIALALGAVPPLGSSAPGQPLAPGPAAPGRPLIPAPPTAVEFIISGYAPADSYGGKPVIGYGSGRFTGEAEPDQINGTITYEVPFSWAAHSYFVNVFLAMTGHVTCKVVLVGPYPDRPVALSSAAAAGELATCSAVAAPGVILSGWLSWQDQARHLAPAGSRNATTAGPGPYRPPVIGNGIAVLGQQGYPPPASAATQPHGTPGQIQAGA